MELDDIFTVDDLKNIKALVSEIGFPHGGQVETTIFCSLVKAYAQVKASNEIKQGLLELRDGILKSASWITDK